MRHASLALLLAIPLACGAEPAGNAPGSAGAESPAEALPLRLAERYGPQHLHDAVPIDADAIPRSEWRFAEVPEADQPGGWRALRGVGDLRLADGALRGVTTDATPVVAAERTTPVGPEDRIHSVVVRARVSAGRALRVRLAAAPDEDPAQVERQVGDFLFASQVPLQPGDEMRSYTVPAPLRLVMGEETRTLLVSPSDVEGAEFAIESIRLVLLREHLATLPSGRGWHGLGEIYHDGLALRAGESIRLPLDLPRNARLTLELGSVSEGPLRFDLALEDAGGERVPLLRRTLTTAERWERARVDLRKHAGADRTLVFSLHSETPGALGYFGNPVLRSRRPELAGRPRGVVLVVADTLRRDHLESYGYRRDTAPELARRAAEGALFADAVAQGSWTKVSTPSILTGLYQSSHGVTTFTSRLPDAALTLPEIFREAGYATVGYSSVPFTGRFSNMQQGFDSFHELTSLPDSSPKTARPYVDRFLAWLDDHPGVPFFAVLHVFDPHDPFEPRQPFDTLWADPARREQQLREMEETKPFISWPFMKQRGLPNAEELRQAGFDPEAHLAYNKDWYDGSIRGLDAELARVFERMEELGDALLVFVSDHGEEFYEHGSVFHGQTLYGEMLDVPLVFWGPGRVPSGVRVPTTVQTIDILPTLLELAGLPEREVQGRSLVPLMRGAEWKPRPAVAEAANRGDGPPAPRDGWESVAIVSGGWKLIHNHQRPEGEPEFELYHRERDPLDLREVSASFPDEVERLRGELEAWQGWVASTRLDSDGEATELSPEELDRLRELGYVQ